MNIGKKKKVGWLDLVLGWLVGWLVSAVCLYYGITTHVKYTPLKVKMLLNDGIKAKKIDCRLRCFKLRIGREEKEVGAIWTLITARARQQG
jgi:hypothetical protein